VVAPAQPQGRQQRSIPHDGVLAAYVLVGRRDEPWPARLAREPVDSFAFLERYGEPLPSAQARA
jgi:hypothetical protein